MFAVRVPSNNLLIKISQVACLALGGLLISTCQTMSEPSSGTKRLNPEDILTVDCLLPPQVRQLGTSISYLAPRLPIRTSGAQCELRGGEYVAYDRADFRSALSVWLPKAKQGDPIAQTYVGEIYEKGLGTRASFELASSWYELAASQGHARAQINLGYLYESGLGVKQDLTRALNLYRQAAGFTKANLEYVSSIEIAKRRAATLETQQLRSQLGELESQLEAKRKQLQRGQSRLAQSEKNLENLKELHSLSQPQHLESQSKENQTPHEPEINTENNDLTEKLQEQNQELIEQRDRNQRKLESLMSQVQARESELERQSLEVKALQKSVLEKQLLLPPLPAEQITQTVPDSPNINIIDPPVMLTRSAAELSVKSRQPINLIGRIDPADELFAFRINGLDHPYTDTGMFNFVSTKNDINSLDLVAINNQGQSTRINISISSLNVTAGAQSAQQVNHSVNHIKNELPKTPLYKTPKDVDFGEYHALIIGNNDYESIGDLQSAITDATAVERLLREKYGFQTVLLRNATQTELLNALERMRVTLGPNDNLVIYYAGHGELDKLSGRGYWLPTDASKRNKKKWISNSSIAAMIDSMQAKHVMVIADSCFSGAMTQSSVARKLPNTSPQLRDKWLKAIARSRVRTVLSSGGLHPVLDSAPNTVHSLFAKQFLEVLQQNDDVIEAYALFFDLQQSVSQAASELHVMQVPQYAPIRHAGHQAGEFLFVPRVALD